MQVIVMSAGDIRGVVHSAPIVFPPALVIALERPDLPIPDQVFDAKGFGIILDPVRDIPPQFTLFGSGALPNGIAESDVTGPPQWMLGFRARAG